MKVEDDKCWLETAPDLSIKRYLSHTRTFFREGVWIRECFLPFFPATGIDESDNIFFDLRSIEPPCDFDSYTDLSSSKIPLECYEAFAEAFKAFNTRIKTGRLNFNEDISSKEFTLPDPRLHPEIYLLAKEKDGFRLIILWGLSSDKELGNLGLQTVCQVLKENFIGEVTVKKSRSIPIKVPKLSKGTKPASPEPTPVVTPPTPVDPVAPVDPVTPVAPVAPVAPTTPPQEALKTVEIKKAEPTPPKPIPAKAEEPKLLEPKKPKPVKQKAVKPKSDKPKIRKKKGIPKWVKTGAIALPLLGLAFIVLKTASTYYLGENVIARSINESPYNRTITAQAGQEIELPDGSIIPARDKDSSLTLSLFPKPGKYTVTKRSKEGDPETTSIIYSNSRNDFDESPIASLSIKTPIQLVNQPVEAIVNRSFHEAGESKTLNYSIDWGDSANGLQEITTPNKPISHSYEATGTYKITLIVKDSDSAWDYDTVNVKIVETVEETQVVANRAPVPDIEIASIIEKENGYLVTVDFQQSYDIDGEIQSLTFDWGDKSELETVDAKLRKADHLYKKRTKRVAVKVIATDAENFNSPKPAILNLDFLSAQMNDSERFSQAKETKDATDKIISDKQGELQVLKSTLEQLSKTKKAFKFAIDGIQSNPDATLMNAKWTLSGANIEDHVIKNANEIEILATDGIYFLKLSVETPDGETYELTHRFSVRVLKNLPFPLQIATWLSEVFS